MEIKRLTAASVIDLIAAIATFASDQRAGQTIWYRGSHCSKHRLLPGIARGVATDGESCFALEARLITMFRQRSLPFWPEGYQQTDWEHMFSMQHHGVKTRLLDWSENAFVGLWFALDGGCNANPAHDDCNPVLWLLDPQELNRVSLAHVHEDSSLVPILTTADEDIKPYAPETVSPSPRRIKSAVAVYGTHNSARISAQRGVFTVAGKDLAPIEDSVESAPGYGKRILAPIDLKGDADAFRDELGRLGFTTSMIYPDLPGLARDLDAHMSRK